MICSTLASLWKFQYDPVAHLQWNFYCENTKPLSIFTVSSMVDARLGSKYVSVFWRIFKRLHYKTLEICYFFKVLYYFWFFKHVIKHLIVKPFDLLNTITLTRTKTLVNNLLMSKGWTTLTFFYHFLNDIFKCHLKNDSVVY